MFPKNLSLLRLGYSIEKFERELEVLIEQAKSRSNNHPSLNWQTLSSDLLKLAKEAHERGDQDRGWPIFKAAERFSYFGLETSELPFEASAILAEATDGTKMLSGWRRAAILLALADKDEKLRGTLSHREVVVAKRILDEHFDNRYHKHTILKRRLVMLTVTSLIAAVAWIAYPPLSPLLSAQSQFAGVLAGRRLWLAVVLMGIMGALVSGFSTSMGSSQKLARIPDELIASTVTMARISMAVITSVVVSVFLVSGLLNLPTPSPGVLLAVAFVSGFSDRLVLRAVESISL